MRISPCLEKIGDDLYRCRNRGFTVASPHRTILCACDNNPIYIHQTPTCPMAAAVIRLTAHGLGKLALCHSAKCGHLKRSAGIVVCTKRGSACEWLDVWTAFLNQDRQCPQWVRES